MFTRPLGFLLLAGACVMGTAAGAYFALRSGAPPAETPAESAVLAEEPALADLPPGVVTETEARLTEATTPPPTAAPDPAPAPRPVAERRTEAPRRQAPARSEPRREPARREPPPPAPDPEPAELPAAAPLPSLGGAWPSRGDDDPRGTNGPASTPTWLPTADALPTEPAPPEYEELIVAADSVIGLQLDTTVTTEQAKVEDPVEARVTRDVQVAGRVAVPAGARIQGSVVLVEPGGKVKERARLGIRFHTLVLADGSTVPLRTETIYREGASPAGESTAKIGGAAVGGAILGAILGGTKGAVIGGSAGAAGGTAAVMAGGRNPAVFQAGSSVTVRLSEPVTIAVEK